MFTKWVIEDIHTKLFIAALIRNSNIYLHKDINNVILTFCQVIEKKTHEGGNARPTQPGLKLLQRDTSYDSHKSV